MSQVSIQPTVSQKNLCHALICELCLVREKESRFSGGIDAVWPASSNCPPHSAYYCSNPQCAHGVQRSSNRRIRPAAAGPRRLQVSTGHLLKAAFRIRPPNNQKHKKTNPKGLVFLWWGRTDSNHRSDTQQIYSLSPLATRELPHIQFAPFVWLEPVDGLEPPTY